MPKIEGKKQELVFEPSGLISNPNNLEEFEFYGHDSGVYLKKEEVKPIDKLANPPITNPGND